MEKLIEEARALIKPNMNVSFGGGRTVGRLIKSITDKSIKVSSPSEMTRDLCRELNIPVVPLDQVDKFDLAFDGCDSLDADLNVLKSNGGIHTFEKLYANLAKRYIILAPEARSTKELNNDIPLCLEVMELAIPQVKSEVEKLGGKMEVRQSSEMAGIVRTVNGNALVDCHFEDWKKIDEIDATLGRMTGVIGTSYFKNLVTDALLSSGDDVIHLQRK
ncbi:ribose-5-phosphate isomerase A [Companilactobacillus sp. HBUAS56275]|uniref:ribose-5-phosphate isomerase n=1 Tax=Candidatus Companilactobacillus pullicola TaxID=2838523 RepID=A0A9D2CP74_9LACO|nr:ribose-5-phosphate isomerase A [Candidatus Companilactobacillus pullicola]